MNVDLLQKTFAIIRLRPTEFAASFYQNLFQDYPQVKQLFANTNIEDQERKLMTALVAIVSNIRHLTNLEKLLEHLGERHLKYGVRLEHYQMLGSTLIKTLESYLEEDWNLEVKQVWTQAYQTIVKLMVEGARSKNSFQDDSSSDLTFKMAMLRAEAIAQRALRDGRSINLLTQALLKDYYFQELDRKLGKAKTLELISEVVKKASHKELSHNRVTLS